jgi:hypothetical protein
MDTSSINYLPLHVGNIYVFKKTHYSYPNFYSYSYLRYIISDDTVANGKRYFKFNGFPKFGSGWIRVDSLTGSVMKFDLNCNYYNGEKLIDSLKIKKLGTNCQRDSCGNPGNFICSDTSYIVLFNINTQIKEFRNSQFTYFYTYRRYAKNIGLYLVSDGSSIPHGEYSITYLLMGCVINNVLYGDTSVPLGINELSNSPFSPSLSQNYPNPFNPVTKIKYDIPSNVKSEKSNVKIIVYDILGSEIETLVNETQKPGSYEVDWDGSRYASGVYFYRLITDEYIETKKMVLIK